MILRTRNANPAAEVNGNVWAVDFADDKVVHFPKPNKDSRCKLNGPLHLAIDQQDRVWIPTRSAAPSPVAPHVTRTRSVFGWLTGTANRKVIAIWTITDKPMCCHDGTRLCCQTVPWPRLSITPPG